MALLFAVMASDVGFAIRRIRFPKQTTEVASEWRFALPLTDCINCHDFVIPKIVMGFVVGGGGIVLLVDCGNLTSFTCLMNGFQFDGKSHGLMQRLFVDFHDPTSDRLVEAREK